MIVKQITSSNWILTSSVTGKKLGVVVKTGDKMTVLGIMNRQFDSFEQIAEHYEESYLHDSEEDDDADIESFASDIEGYPVRHKTVFDITSDSVNNLHLYKTTKNSRTCFVAGYFCVKFKKSGWSSRLCPKIDTLLEYEYTGPYKNKYDMQFHILKNNREGK